MDFARKQLEKYGWSDGKGLGKNENGIAEALKPKIKRSVTGIGHDPAADFTEHWWSALYDKAAKNVEVKEKNGKTKKIKTKETDFQITNSTYHLNKKSKKTKSEDKNSTTNEYSDYFIKTAVLDGVKTEMVDKEQCESEEDEDIQRKEKKDVFKMSDEELFAACEGRTAHKGARHGLKATGKLARIQRQEQLLLLQPQYSGYSHAKKIKKSSQVVENTAISTENTTEAETSIDNSENLGEVVKKKKKKHKSVSNGNHEGSFENTTVTDEENILAEKIELNKLKQDMMDKMGNSANAGEVVEKKRKKYQVVSNGNYAGSFENTTVTDELNILAEKIEVKQLKRDTNVEMSIDKSENTGEVVKKKKKKRKYGINENQESSFENTTVTDENRVIDEQNMVSEKFKVKKLKRDALEINQIHESTVKDQCKKSKKSKHNIELEVTLTEDFISLESGNHKKKKKLK